MKRILTLLLIAVALAPFGAKADQSAKEKTFLNQIYNYVKGEGYQPSWDSDGDIKFKAQGSTYYISAEEYDEGYYVSLYGFMGTTDANRRGILEAINKTTSSLKYFRAYLNSDKEIVYQCSGYFSNLYQFKAMFSHYLDVLELGDKRLKDYYSEWD